MPAFAHFEIDIGRALIEQMYEIIDGLSPAPLTEAALEALPDGLGVYQLYYQGKLVYIGKAKTSLKKRLEEHRFKIEGRRNIKLNDMAFTCLILHENWNPLVHESGLIANVEHIRGHKLDWNGNGFGPHDPGRERETTQKSPDGFDARFPILQSWRPRIEAGNWRIDELLFELKKQLPFLLRFQKASKNGKRPHPDYSGVGIRIPVDNMPLDLMMGLIASRVPGWQATAFPSHFIFYKERKAYVYGKNLSWRGRLKKGKVLLPQPKFKSSIF